MRVAPEIVLTEDERSELLKLTTSRLTSVRLSQRAQIVLLAAEGMQNLQIAEHLGIGRIQVARWRGRYGQMRLAGIERDLPRGAPPKKVELAQLVELTTQSKPEAATHWSSRKMAAKLGVHRDHHLAPLEGGRTEAAYRAGFQGLARSEVCRET